MPPFDRTTAIAQLQTLLEQRLGKDVSPIELAEVLWLALQRGDAIPQSGVELNSDSEPTIEVIESSGPAKVVSPGQVRPPVASIVTQPPTNQIDDERGPALPVRLPDAVALRNRREITKALRPLMRKVPSRRRSILDEEATAIAIAETQILQALMRPDRECWLELAIVIEVTNVFDVWQLPIQEFTDGLRASGAFRAVQVWQMQSDAMGKPQLFQQRGKGLKGPPRQPRELLDPMGDRLILCLSDCTSLAWRSGQIPALLALWMRQNPVTIVQLLPPAYWDRSALKDSVTVGLRPPSMGALNRYWRVVGMSARRRRRLPLHGLKLPVVTIDPVSLGLWAQALVAAAEQATVGVVLDVAALAERFKAQQQRVETPVSTPPEALVDRFYRTASIEAQNLAEVLALVPLDWAVMRLVQKNILGETAALYLAEMVLSGLIMPLGERTIGQPRPYDFIEGVRERLVQAIGPVEAKYLADEVAEEIVMELLPEAAKQKLDDILDRLSNDIEQRYGESPSYFEAFLVADQEWDDSTMQGLRLGRVAEQVLRTWGPEYAQIADRLKQGVPTFVDVLPVVEPVLEPVPAPLPLLKTFEFETVQLVPHLTPPELVAGGPATFEFETAKLEVQQSGLRRKPKIVITKSQGTAQGYVESLDASVGLDMVVIPAGQFVMGAPKGEAESDDDERPQHQVTVSQFWMGRYAVTQAQWRVVAGWDEIDRTLDPAPSHFKGDNRPVEQVSWLDTIEFCQRLSAKTGRDYRLPSEAEWEYACRAGTTDPFYFGETITVDLVNYDGNYIYGKGKKSQYREKTIDVGSFPANGFGLHDMHGNVWEWCLDDWHDSYEGAPDDGSAWLIETAETASSKVLRGGSWIYSPRWCRSAYRNHVVVDANHRSIGFRVVCAPPGLSSPFPS
jgi:formylglycine-generating enzyme required for sulfatase activity